MFTRVATHEQLQALLWLAEHPDAIVSPEPLAAALGLTDLAEVEMALAALVESELIARVDESAPRFRYGPRSDDCREEVRLLSRTYAQHQAEVLHVMADNSVQRVRNSAARAFLRPHPLAWNE